MLFVLQLLQLAAKRLMMRLAIQQLGKHDRFPPAGCCMRWPAKGRAQSRWLGESEHHGGRVVAAPTVRFVQRHNMAALAEPKEPPWGGGWGGGGAARQPTFPHFSFLLFSKSRIQKPKKTELWSNMQGSLKLFNILTLLLSPAWFMDFCHRLNSCSCKKQTQTVPWNMFIHVLWMRPSK